MVVVEMGVEIVDRLMGGELAMPIVVVVIGGELLSPKLTVVVVIVVGPDGDVDGTGVDVGDTDGE